MHHQLVHSIFIDSLHIFRYSGMVLAIWLQTFEHSLICLCQDCPTHEPCHHYYLCDLYLHTHVYVISIILSDLIWNTKTSLESFLPLQMWVALTYAIPRIVTSTIVSRFPCVSMYFVSFSTNLALSLS